MKTLCQNRKGMLAKLEDKEKNMVVYKNKLMTMRQKDKKDICLTSTTDGENFVQSRV
jgi:hypothetical protein